MNPSAASVKDREALGRRNDADGNRPHSFLRWIGAKVSKAVGWLRAVARIPVRLAKHVLRFAKSLARAAIGEDRGFGFWWLVVTLAIALTIGLLVAALLSPVIGVLAALVVGIWMLIRRSRSSHSRGIASAAPAN